MRKLACMQHIDMPHVDLPAQVDVSLTLDAGAHAVRVRGLAKTVDGTGVEMEALTAVSLASLTVYDMCKALAKVRGAVMSAVNHLVCCSCV